MSDAFDTHPWTLDHILSSIDNGQIVIPEFQRDFVWDPHTIIDLIVSISNKYPAGSLLFSKARGPTILPSRLVEGVVQATLSPEHLILDGQQRLTSLYQAFYGKGRHRFFINLADLQKYQNLEDAIFFEKKEKAEKKFGTFHDQFETDILPLTILFDKKMNVDRWLDEYLDYKKLSDEQRKESREKFRDMHEKFLKNIERYAFPIVELNEKTGLDAICKIFENLNVKGVKLTTFEILTAKLYPCDINLRELWQDAKDTHPLISRFLGDDESTYILKIICLLFNKNPKSCKRSDMLNLTAEDIKNYWEFAIKYLEKALAILTNECGVLSRKWLPYVTILPPLAAALYELEKSSNGALIGKGKRIIERWYWCNVFEQRYDSAIDTKSADDITALNEWIQRGMPIDFVENFQTKSVDLKSAYTERNAVYAGVICLIVRNDALDFHKRTKISTLDIIHDGIDDHHVFPKAYLKELGAQREVYNNILNKTLIDSETNQQIGRKAPSEYLNEIEDKIGKDELEKILKTHKLIIDSKSPIFSDEFQKFLEERKNLFLNMIEEVTKN